MSRNTDSDSGAGADRGEGATVAAGRDLREGLDLREEGSGEVSGEELVKATLRCALPCCCCCCCCAAACSC